MSSSSIVGVGEEIVQVVVVEVELCSSSSRVVVVVVEILAVEVKE